MTDRADADDLLSLVSAELIIVDAARRIGVPRAAGRPLVHADPPEPAPLTGNIPAR